MRTLAPTLVLMLALLTGGVVETLAAALDDHAGCVDGEGGAGGGCASTCSTCACCPVRAAPVSVVLDLEGVAPRTDANPLPKVRITQAVPSDIFQPPRA